MPTKGLSRTLERLRQALAPERPDDELLRTFIALRDEAAFAQLVRRHGRMVLGVARRVLGNLHESEDVFQATFLVLAQKARSVSKQGAIASWLYKVAYRISLKARARNVRRCHTERKAAMLHQHKPAPGPQDWEAALDEELHRLPEKYRLPVILCDLEGRSRKEAERQLGLAEGTLSSRLARARHMLAARLSRRGIALSAGLGVALSQACAGLPPGLVGSTAKTAVSVSAGHLAGISGSVLVLMKIGVKAMFLAKLKATLATVVVLAFVGGGIVYSGGAGQAQPKTDFESLRRENELLKVNQRALLERIETLEKQLASTKERGTAKARLEQEERRLVEAEKAFSDEFRARLAQEDMRRRLEAEIAEKKAQDLAILRAQREQEEARKRMTPAEFPRWQAIRAVGKKADADAVGAAKNAGADDLRSHLNSIANDAKLPKSVRRAAREALKLKRGSNGPANESPKAGVP